MKYADGGGHCALVYTTLRLHTFCLFAYFLQDGRHVDAQVDVLPFAHAHNGGQRRRCEFSVGEDCDELEAQRRRREPETHCASHHAR